jgi:hypothetical protein
MQIQSTPLLSSPYASSVAAPQSISVGQRASLTTQRQGSRLATWVNKLKLLLDRLRPDRFSKDQRQLILDFYPSNQHQELTELLQQLRYMPLTCKKSHCGENHRRHELNVDFSVYLTRSYNQRRKFILEEKTHTLNDGTPIPGKLSKLCGQYDSKLQRILEQFDCRDLLSILHVVHGEDPHTGDYLLSLRLAIKKENLDLAKEGLQKLPAILTELKLPAL